MTTTTANFEANPIVAACFSDSGKSQFMGILGMALHISQLGIAPVSGEYAKAMHCACNDYSISTYQKHFSLAMHVIVKFSALLGEEKIISKAALLRLADTIQAKLRDATYTRSPDDIRAYCEGNPSMAQNKAAKAYALTKAKAEAQIAEDKITARDAATGHDAHDAPDAPDGISAPSVPNTPDAPIVPDNNLTVLAVTVGAQGFQMVLDASVDLDGLDVIIAALQDARAAMALEITGELLQATA